jgi:hypothetical protein
VINPIFIVEHPFTKRDYDRFGFRLLAANAHKPVVWDLSPFLNADLWNTLDHAILASDSIVFHSVDEVCAKVKTICHLSSVILVYISSNNRTLPIFQSFDKYSIVYGLIYGASLPFPLSTHLRSSLSCLKYIPILRQASLCWKSFIWRYFFGVKGFSFVFITGLDYSKSILESTHTKKYFSCTYDYNLYLESSKSDSDFLDEEMPPYAVFLDENLPSHSDYIHMNVTSPMAEETYYSYLRSFFTHIESRFGVQIIIALHPKTPLSDSLVSKYGSRKLYSGHTQELIKSSRFAICHGSTSIGFAVLYKKPLIFTNFRSLMHYRDFNLYGFYEAMAASLGKTPVYLDEFNCLSFDLCMCVNHALYEDYIQSYLRHPLAPNITSVQYLSAVLSDSCVMA